MVTSVQLISEQQGCKLLARRPPWYLHGRRSRLQAAGNYGHLQGASVTPELSLHSMSGCQVQQAWLCRSAMGLRMELLLLQQQSWRQTASSMHTLIVPRSVTPELSLIAG